MSTLQAKFQKLTIVKQTEQKYTIFTGVSAWVSDMKKMEAVNLGKGRIYSFWCMIKILNLW